MGLEAGFVERLLLFSVFSKLSQVHVTFILGKIFFIPPDTLHGLQHASSLTRVRTQIPHSESAES